MKIYRTDGSEIELGSGFKGITVGEVVEHAAKHGISLKNADLRGVSLCLRNLTRADLTGANLTQARLIGTRLNGADLTGADLRRAELLGADLTGAKLDYKIQSGLLEQVAQAALETPDSLEMFCWNACDTSHCIAGWACHLNPVAAALEETHGMQIAGLLTLGAEAHSHFFDSNDDARNWLKSILNGEQ